MLTTSIPDPSPLRLSEWQCLYNVFSGHVRGTFLNKSLGGGLLCSQDLLHQLLFLRSSVNVPLFCWLPRRSVQKRWYCGTQQNLPLGEGKLHSKEQNKWGTVKWTFSNHKIQMSGQRATFIVHHAWPCKGNTPCCFQPSHLLLIVKVWSCRASSHKLSGGQASTI